MKMKGASAMRHLVAIGLALAAALVCAWPSRAQPSDDEDKIRAVIADWYRRVGGVVADAPWILMAPGGIDDGPGYAEIPRLALERRSRAGYSGLMINN